MVFALHQHHIVTWCHKALYLVMDHIPYFPSFGSFPVDFLFPGNFNFFQLLFFGEVFLGKIEICTIKVITGGILLCGIVVHGEVVAQHNCV